MSNPIRNILSAAGLLAVTALAAAGLLMVGETPAHATCQINGPTNTAVDQAFSLCGPSISGSTYEWSGPGISSTAYARCVNIDGLAQGGYQFTLIRRINGAEVERCTRVVNVGNSTGGVESCAITGPDTINEGTTATLCAPQDGIHSYSWTGPSGATSTAGCITATDEGTYTLTSRNRITGSSRTCSHQLTVNGFNGNNNDCDITGPTTVTAGSSVQLCAPSYANSSYRWTGPNGFVGSTSCINVRDGGTYAVTMRNLSTGRTTSCSQALTAVDQGSGSTCDIAGATNIPAGSSVQICAPSFSNTSYRWTGPGAFASSNRCVNVVDGGNYILTMRNLGSGRTTTCNQVMTADDQGNNDNPDSPITDNCPRNLQFWRGVVGSNGSNGGTNLNSNELLVLARAVDTRSAYLNWSNDVSGLRAALNPGQSLTRRKQVIRQFATLLANVAAGEANLTSDDGSNIGLDADTAVDFGGARTIGELIALTDRLLSANRGNFAKLNSTLVQINSGRGIGSVCE